MISYRCTRTRLALLTSTALLALPSAAYADDARPDEAFDSPHGITVSIGADISPPEVNLIPSSVMDVARPGDVVDVPNITINNNFTPTDARDPTNITGIGQFVSDAGGGSVGLCTATLINPRVVLFAAHCVNTRAATAYGAGSGGVGAAIGFETNTRANAAGQPDELVNWLLGAGAGPGQFRTNQAQSLYNISQVFYDPRSLAAASCTNPTSCFLEADIATAVLDTPTRNVPTWALLFSPLTTPAAINPATGTGYHVTIGGYGRFGTGTTGQNGGNDFRRRAAENMLGALTSISSRNLFLFGTTGSPARPQLLYWLDFDDPARGTAGADPEDFNGFRDNALTREGLTGPGDSGGPLILDQTFARQVIIGTLSGGSTFFAGQPGGSYGAQSFYQPLFLYWDWVVANNPYRYVTATAGNKNWEDTTAWVTELDPNYMILSGGALVNGLPTNLGGANAVTTPAFGEVCFQSPLNSAAPPATNECENLTTGAPRNGVPNTPSGTGESSPTLTADLTDAAQPDDVAVAGGALGASGGFGLDGAFDSPAADPGFSDTVRPAPTLANGLPGATGFTPNNVDGVRATGVMGRYYDVTLRNAGIVTLSSTVTIDRFSIVGASSGLTINTGASLTSLIDVNQLTGIVNVNGTLTTPGDYLFMSGMINGTGRINTPFLTSALGNFAPGTLGTTGTLTLGGNLVMASGSTYAIDLGANGVSDRIVAVANGTSTGSANVGGRLLFTPTSSVLAGNSYTILTAAGGVTGAFTSPTDLSAILKPTVSYTATSVLITITTNSYASVVAGGSPVQIAYASLLDANRGTAGVAPIYATLDLQNAATIRSTLDALAPRTESLKTSVATGMLDSTARLLRDRVIDLQPGSGMGGSVAYIGAPAMVAMRAASPFAYAGSSALAQGTADGDARVAEGKLPETMSVFFAGGFLDGNSAPMPTAVPAGGRDQYDGIYVATGLEFEAGSNAALGLAVTWSTADGETAVLGQSSEVTLLQGSFYGKAALGGGLNFDGVISLGSLRATTKRNATIIANSYTLTSSDRMLAVSGEIGLSKMFGTRVLVGPRVALRGSRINFDTVSEVGGPPALTINREAVSSVQGRAGIDFSGQSGMFRPFGSVSFVHDFEERPALVSANFVGGAGSSALFAMTGTDQNWAEISGGFALDFDSVVLSLSADTTIGRDDLTNRSYRMSIRVRF